MKTKEIDMLLQARDLPCISIIIPTDRLDRKKNYLILKKSIQKVNAMLKTKPYDQDIIASMSLTLGEIWVRFPETVYDGLGIYISPKRSSIIPLPFKVRQKIEIGDRFEPRDLQYLKQYSTPYYVLNLSKHGVHLFRGLLNSIEEIKDGKFPFIYSDQFEYARASTASSSSSSLKGFEKDKSVISELRLAAVFREADVKMRSYLTGQGAKFLLAGPQKLISVYLGLTLFEAHFFGKISGSFNDNNFKKLKEIARTTFMRNKKNDLTGTIKGLQEKANGHLAAGLQNSWSAALEGKGQLLVVEKDFHQRAYKKPDQFRLLLQPPKKPYTIIPDAVDALIDTVQAKNGSVLFTEGNELSEFGHLALVLRY